MRQNTERDINILTLNVTEKKILEKKKNIKCSQCDFDAISEHGLKVHMKRKHTITGIEKYPRNCDICDVKVDNQKKLKEHMKTHSYKEAKFKCEECEFIGENEYTMDVHNGKLHSDKFECGICEINTKGLEELELHLFSCEIYKCHKDGDCNTKFKTLSEIKAHITADHIYSGFEHLKLDRNFVNEVTVKTYYFEVDEDQ